MDNQDIVIYKTFDNTVEYMYWKNDMSVLPFPAGHIAVIRIKELGDYFFVKIGNGEDVFADLPTLLN